MFKASRVFSHRNPNTGFIEWYFSAREGNFGPFNDMQTAAKELDAFIQDCIKNGHDGGRAKGAKNEKLSLVPMHGYTSKRRD